MTDKVRLVPKYDVEWEDIERAVEDLGGREQDAEEGVSESWDLGGTAVHLFDDPGLGIQQLVVEGGDNERVAAQLRERIPTFTAADMPALFDQPEEEFDFSEGLGILAVVAPPQADSGLVELFRRGFTHDDPFVREQAALAATVPGWPELRADIERMAQEDEDDDVRTTAAGALSDIREDGS
jgi:hypothetical protein